MSVKENKAAIKRLYEAMNNNQFDVLNEVLDPHFVAHGETMALQPGQDHLSAIKQGIMWTKNVFPDLVVTIDDLVGEGDKVVARLTWRGTQKEPVFGVPGKGTPIEWTGIAINRFKGGKVVERWFNTDELGMLRNMNLVPPAQGG